MLSDIYLDLQGLPGNVHIVSGSSLVGREGMELASSLAMGETIKSLSLVLSLPDLGVQSIALPVRLRFVGSDNTLGTGVSTIYD